MRKEISGDDVARILRELGISPREVALAMGCSEQNLRAWTYLPVVKFKSRAHERLIAALALKKNLAELGEKIRVAIIEQGTNAAQVLLTQAALGKRAA